MLLLNGNPLIELSVLTQLRTSDTAAFIASHGELRDVRIARTALQVARLRVTAGDLLGAYRYATAAAAIAARLDDGQTVEQADRIRGQVAFAVSDCELATLDQTN